jgi:hypothetical protein
MGYPMDNTCMIQMSSQQSFPVHKNDSPKMAGHWLKYVRNNIVNKIREGQRQSPTVTDGVLLIIKVEKCRRGTIMLAPLLHGIYLTNNRTCEKVH